MRPELTLLNWQETASLWALFEVHFLAQQLGEKRRHTGECKGGLMGSFQSLCSAASQEENFIAKMLFIEEEKK